MTDVREALAELVACDDLRIVAERAVATCKVGAYRLLTEHADRSALAWAAARAALAQEPDMTDQCTTTGDDARDTEEIATSRHLDRASGAPYHAALTQEPASPSVHDALAALESAHRRGCNYCAGDIAMCNMGSVECRAKDARAALAQEPADDLCKWADKLAADSLACGEKDAQAAIAHADDQTTDLVRRLNADAALHGPEPYLQVTARLEREAAAAIEAQAATSVTADALADAERRAEAAEGVIAAADAMRFSPTNPKDGYTVMAAFDRAIAAYDRARAEYAAIDAARAKGET